MKLIKITHYKNMASGRNYCALVSNGVTTKTGFGKTEEEAEQSAINNFSHNKKK